MLSEKCFPYVIFSDRKNNYLTHKTNQMEENLLPVIPTFKLYKENAIYVGTFLGGPLVAGYLMAENFKQLGQQEKVKTTWIIGIAASIVIFGGAFLIPNIEKVPNYVIPLIYLGITQFFVKKYQSAAIKTHIETGGSMYSIWRAVLVGFIGLIIIAAIIIGIILLTTPEVFQ